MIVDGHLSTINVATRYALTVPKCHQEVSVRFLQRKSRVFSDIVKFLVFLAIIIQFEKFRKALTIATQLAELVAECSGMEFHCRCELLKQLLHAWERT